MECYIPFALSIWHARTDDGSLRRSIICVHAPQKWTLRSPSVSFVSSEVRDSGHSNVEAMGFYQEIPTGQAAALDPAPASLTLNKDEIFIKTLESEAPQSLHVIDRACALSSSNRY